MYVYLAWLVAALAAGGAAAQPPEPVIDVHMHSHAADRAGRPGLPNPVTGRPSASTTDETLLGAARAAMDRYGIVSAVALSGRPSTMRWVEADRRFIGGVQIDVGLPKPDLAQLRGDIQAGRIKVIGEIGAQYMWVGPNDPSLQPYYDLAEEFDLPVGIHTGISAPNTPYQCCDKFRTALGDPQLLEDLLVQRPKLRVYMQHAGYPYLGETKAVLGVYPQVYADLSAIVWALPEAEFYDYLQALMRAGFGQRLMFGSDQMIWPEQIGPAIERIQRAPFLTGEQKRDILYNNAARFFRLSPESQARPGAGTP